MSTTEITRRISELKKNGNALILAHLYQLPEVQDISDFTGDSLELSRRAKESSAEVIVLCGVTFMAETAKILSPQKTVLLPEPDAGCPMADMVSASDIERLRKEHPNAAVVCYVNSSAEVKAASDICCTSSNAIKVVESLSEDEIIFVPDRNLGRYVSGFFPEKRFIYHTGFCPVHELISVADVKNARSLHPHASVLAHPECSPEVLDLADFIGSTAKIIDYAGKSNRTEFIIVTETGILHRLNTLYPKKRFYPVRSDMTCRNMKKTTLQKVAAALENMQYPIHLDQGLIDKAYACLDRMLRL
ncbi:MAG: quinolinate synthase NadA [Bacillota bacterium]